MLNCVAAWTSWWSVCAAYTWSRQREHETKALVGGINCYAQLLAVCWCHLGHMLVVMLSQQHHETDGFPLESCVHYPCSIAAGVGRAFSCICLSACLFVCALKGKRLELSTPNLIHVYSVIVARYAQTHRSKSRRSRSHGYENRQMCHYCLFFCSSTL